MEKVKCCKCRKEINLKKAVEGYNTFFCSKKCYKIYDKEADKELERGLKEIGF
ncbi:MAG: hypothetical protein KKE05_06760 [Nanoarchaeota archaeon]|nr:hypothetical protein [Nanoarchaeota archaeon]